MGSRSPAQLRAEVFERELSKGLRVKGLGPSIKVSRHVDKAHQLEVWEAKFRVLVRRDPLRGIWTLQGYWRFVDDVGGGEAIVWDTSMGWNVADHVFGSAPQEISLVRYDFERAGRGLHLNVHQPPPLGSNVHYVIPLPDPEQCWDEHALLEWLLGDALESDLLNAGWH